MSTPRRCAPTCAASCAPSTSARPSPSAAGSPAAASTASTSPSSTCATTPASSSASSTTRSTCAASTSCASPASCAPRPEGTVNPNLPTGEVEIGDCAVEVLRTADAAAVPDRRPGRRRRRGRPPAVPLPRPAARADAAQPARPGGGQLGRPPGDGGAGLRRGRDADARAVDAGGRPRVPRAVAQGAGLVLRPAAVAAAVQAAADGRRRRPLLPDRPLPARRGPARRPPVRVHAARRRDELRRPGRRAGGDQRGGARRRRGGDRGAAAGDRADHVARGDGPLRRRQARPALRDGARRAHRRLRRHRVQGVRRRRGDQGHPGAGRGGGVRPQPARQAHRPGQVARRQGPRVAEGRRRRLVRLAGRQVPLAPTRRRP